MKDGTEGLFNEHGVKGQSDEKHGEMERIAKNSSVSKIFNNCLNGQNIGNRSNKIKNDKKKKPSELEKQNVKQNSLQIESQARTLKKTNTRNSLIKCYNS